MTLLIIYVLVALGFSFLCSIAEAVILSVNPSYVALLEKNHWRTGHALRQMLDDINRPLAAILTLNTVAHTIGAAGAGAQAAAVFGSAYVGIASAVLTLLILVFSEIIPKTLGAYYWRRLVPGTVYGLRLLIPLMLPFVKLSELITSRFAAHSNITGFSRREFAALAELGGEEGKLEEREIKIVKNLLHLRDTRVKDVMTPRMVMFSLPETSTVGDYIEQHGERRFSRVPVYGDHPEAITGFVLRTQLLSAQAEGKSERPLTDFLLELPALPDKTSLSHAFEYFLETRAHIMLVVDEYGGVQGLVTLEDLLETLLGLEIVDEGDSVADLQQQARDMWRRRASAMGLSIDEPPPGNERTDPQH